VCATAATGGVPGAANGGCVSIDCPGDGAFAIDLTLYDEAGNPSTTTVENITCESDIPQVQFLDPVDDSPSFGTQTRRILAADAEGTDQRKDADPYTTGAQYDVTVCTTTDAGTARLLAAREGNTLEQRGTTVSVVADTAGLCDGLSGADFTGTATFVDVTLPQSGVDAAFDLTAPTQVVAEITTPALGVGSGEIAVWVDSTAPELRQTLPAGLCDSVIDSEVDVYRDFSFTSPVLPVNLWVNSSFREGTVAVFGVVNITDVLLPVGINTLTASIAEPSGNVGEWGPCSVTVDNVPEVTWDQPVFTKLAAIDNDEDDVVVDGDVAAGWQGTLEVCTDIDAIANPDAWVTITSSIDGVLADEQSLVDQCVLLNDVTLSEAASNVLTAVTSEVGGASGRAVITLTVDVTAPDRPTGLAAEVIEERRRESAFALSWISPDDGGQPATGYEVRVANQLIADADFNNDAVTDEVDFSGTPVTPGYTDSVAVPSRIIETDQYFAVQAVDAVGNRSPIGKTTDAGVKAEFIPVWIPAPVAGQLDSFGYAIDGSTDFNKDGHSDLLVGGNTSSNAHLFFGPPPSSGDWAPDRVIEGDVDGFGIAVSAVGDVNNDDNEDFAIGSWFSGDGRVYVFYGYGSDTWPASFSYEDADVVIEADSGTDALYSAAGLGFVIARLGNFDTNTGDDFAIGVPFYDSGNYRGQAVIIRGNDGHLLPDPEDTVLSLPQEFGARAIRIDGAAFGNFGWDVSSQAADGLLVGEPYYGSPPNYNYGILHAFSNQAAAGGSITIGSGTHTQWTGALGEYRGAYPTTYVGDLGDGPVFASLVGYDLMIIDPSSADPFEPPVARLIQSGSASGTPTFAQYHIGGGLPGFGDDHSLFGTDKPDLVIATTTGVPRLFMIDGEDLATMDGSSAVDVETPGVVTITLPLGEEGDWQDISGRATLLRDINHDDYPDIAVGEYNDGAEAQNVDGKVLVLY
jgi:hypothetical protein